MSNKPTKKASSLSDIIPFINNQDLKSLIIQLNKEGRITYVEYCGDEYYFNSDGFKSDRDYIITTDKGVYERVRRVEEYNLCIQYIPYESTIEGRKYITLKIDE